MKSRFGCHELLLSRFVLVTFLFLLVASTWAVEIKRPVDIGFVRLRAMSFAEAEGIVEPLLSDDGKLTYAESRHILVIHDYPDKIEAIKKVIKKLDSEPVNIRIEVTFDEVGQDQRGSIDVKPQGLRVDTGKGSPRIKGRAKVRIRSGTTDFDEVNTQWVLAASGRPARIWVGQTVADALWIGKLAVRNGWWEPEFVWHDLGASLWILPRLVGDNHVQVEVYPRISARGKQRLSYDVKEVSTTVIAADGQTVSIGGMDKGRNRFYRRLFGIGKVYNGRGLAITLTPHIMRVPEHIRKKRDAARQEMEERRRKRKTKKK